MGKLIIFAKYYFAFWSGEKAEVLRSTREPEHIHIFRNRSKQKISAKFWLNPIELAEKGDFSDKELKQIEKDIIENLHFIKEQLIKASKGKKVKSMKITKKRK